MVALKLREYRKRNNMTQDEVASHLKIARVTYSRYESGEHEMTYESLVLLANLFSVSIDLLLGQKSTEILSKSEITMVENFRKLDERGKQSVLAVIDHESKCTYKAKVIKKSAM